MPLEAEYRQEGRALDWTPTAALTGGQVIQVPDGRAAVAPVDVAANKLGAVQVAPNIYRLQKTASIAILRGGRVFWDHSANLAHFKKVNDRDFYVGRAAATSAETDTTVDVIFNVDPRPAVDLIRDGFNSALVGTAAAGGFGYPVNLGGALVLELTATNEAQKVDALSVDGFAIAANAIAEFVVRVLADGGSGSQDATVGVASGTHASDFQSVAEFVALHLDGNATAINAQSDDGTTDVAPVDTTKVYTEGSAVANRFECWMDLADPTSVKIYIEGVRVLSGTTFTLAAATGPLFLIAHVEKALGTDTYKLAIDRAEVRLMEE